MGLNRHVSPWTDELRSRVKDLWSTHSAGMIAEVLKREGHTFTRNSIVGLVHRMNLSGSDKTEVRKTTWNKKPKEPGQHKDRVRIVADGGRSGGLRVITSRQSSETIKLRCVGIECLTPFDDVTGCWYPNEAGSPHLWCNGKRREGSSFCTAHHALVWVPPRPSTTPGWRAAA